MSCEKPPKNTNASLLLPCWTPATTKILQQATCSSWNVLDHMLPNEDHAALLEEVNQSELLNGGLKPARTTSDVKVQDIMKLLRENFGTAADASDADEASVSSVRGDRSRFLTREELQSIEFQERYPHLSNLLESIRETVYHHVTKKSTGIILDPARTSVQMAVYPGDGKSSYPRHCDRSNACKEEYVSPKSPERIITAIYYLTPMDWDAEKDGGCLRLFSSTNDDECHDVPPLSNRMVIFRSDGVEHGVLPSLKRPRVALTTWFYGTTTASATQKSTSSTPDIPLAAVLSSDDLPPPLPVDAAMPETQQENTIFVSIAAYRDSEVGPTLLSLLSTAQFPEHVFIGIVLQWDPDHDTAIQQSLQSSIDYFEASSRVRVLTLHAGHAQGPCYARALCQQLYHDEDYVLQIDSHMRFRPNWDSYLIQQLKELQTKNENDKVMLTTYPVGYHLPNSIPDETRGTVLVPWKFDEDGMLRQRGRLLQPHIDEPTRCYLYAAGFNFSDKTVIADCPYQGNLLRHAFFGEEISLAVRLFSHGYDLYAPTETICFHLWSRAHRPTPLQDEYISEEERACCRERARLVVHEQLRGKGSGLGTVRTAAEFASALGVDFEQRTVAEEATLCGLREQDFVQGGRAETHFEPGSMERKVASLEPKVHDLIATFLSGMQS